MISAPEKVHGINECPGNGNITTSLGEQCPLSILIAEDNSVNQILIERILSKLGYRTDTACNGIQALNALAVKNYDVVLMDVRMPEMDGFEATQAIRRMGIITQPFIIAMTANAMSNDREECLEIGMNEYISKPVRLNEITEKLIKAFEFCSERKVNKAF